MANERPDTAGAGYALPNPQPRAEWLALRVEPAVDPDRPVVDAHHHLWDVAHPRYLMEDLLADIGGSGHRIEATVFVEAEAMYRAAGAEEMRPLGEVEFANGVAAMSASGLYGPARLCAAIVGHADLSLGARVAPVLDALARAGGGRFRGVRHNSTHDPEVRTRWPRGLLRQPAFHEGFACLQERGLTFDAWMYHSQLGDLISLMEQFPSANVVLNHVGGRIGVGRYAAEGARVADEWRRDLLRLAAFPNLRVKLGGLGMAMAGFGFHERPQPPSSDDLAEAWRPWVAACVEMFGPDRCMFESNFPVDKASCSATACCGTPSRRWRRATATPARMPCSGERPRASTAFDAPHDNPAPEMIPAGMVP